MTSGEILKELEALGQESIKKTLLRHGIKEPLYGVKIEEMKKEMKKVKNAHPVAIELYKTGIYDAMYLAGLMVDPEKMTAKELQEWVEMANSASLCEYTVAWVAAESNYGVEKAKEWIASGNESIASSGWATLSSIISIKEDSELDMPLLKELMEKVVHSINNSPNRVKAAMNNFVIAVGTYIKELNELAKQNAKRIGKVAVDVGDTACKIPFALEYIEKAESKNSIGKKRKSARC